MTHSTPRHPLSLTVLIASSLLVVPPPAAGQVPRLALEDCAPENVVGPARCGTLKVWENRDARAGRTLDLYVVVLPASGETSEPDPIYVLTGGPGSAATGSAPGWSRSDARARRTIVLMDQRGTGRSNVLDCLYPDDAPVDVYLGQIFEPEHIAACRARLEGEADLTQYHSPHSLDDLDDLRAALGHEQINLLGSSYGTRAALVYLRRHEPHVRSVVLQASMSMRQVMPMGMAQDAEGALHGVLADCAAMPACAAAYPNLEDDYRVALEGARRPVAVRIRDPRGGAEVDGTLRPAGFAEALRAMMYDPNATRDIPRFLHAAATQHDYSGFAQFGATRAYNIARLAATGMYLSVTCAEDIPFADEAQEYAAGEGTFLADHRARSHFEACRRWARGRVSDDFHAPVVSHVPALVLNGAHDPVTPPRWGADVAMHLSRSFHVVIPHGGHGWGGLEGVDCVAAIRDAFIEDPTARPDTTCLERIRRRPFN